MDKFLLLPRKYTEVFSLVTSCSQDHCLIHPINSELANKEIIPPHPLTDHHGRVVHQKVLDNRI